MAEFIQGLELCRQFYSEAVRPILDDVFPGLRYSAARIGSGSDVLGYDTEMSTDHDWGPRLLLFLSDEEQTRMAEDIRETLGRMLPREFRGYPTGYVRNDDGTLRLDSDPAETVFHHVETTTVGR